MGEKVEGSDEETFRYRPTGPPWSPMQHAEFPDDLAGDERDSKAGISSPSDNIIMKIMVIHY